MLFLETSHEMHTPPQSVFMDGALPKRHWPESERPHKKWPWDIYNVPYELATQLNYLFDLELWVSGKDNSSSFKCPISSFNFPLVLEAGQGKEGSFLSHPLPTPSCQGLSPGCEHGSECLWLGMGVMDRQTPSLGAER